MSARRAGKLAVCAIVAAMLGGVIASAATAQLVAQPRVQAKPQPAPSAASGPPNPVQGFSQNRGQPVHIESTRLEVRDKDKMATFIGNVKVNQGDTELRCKTLVVFYEADGPNAPKDQNFRAEVPGTGGEQRIKKLEARGSVVVTQNDQIATGDTALFDMKTNTVTMVGNVVVTQGQSVLRGDRLVVDMTTGFSRVESGKNGQGRVQGLFLPGGSGPGLPALPGNPAGPAR